MSNLRPSRQISTTGNWIRGVNLGGWLVLERYIAPYQFAITDCHLAGDLCWYPGAISAPDTSDPAYKECDLSECTPYRPEGIYGKPDYPLDEWHLAAAFNDTTVGEQWLNYHFENFIKKEDLIRVKGAGITHLRVPLPHWILGDIQDDEPWIAGDRWKYFLRVCGWARELGLEVWPNIHTAPGSQNGFDNSGLQRANYTCDGWNNHPENVQRSLNAVDQITSQLVSDGVTDVVTGFGILNEPFGDCDPNVYKNFMDEALSIVRENMGPDTGIYVADMFSSTIFNDGEWWLDDEKYSNTYLDSHFYQVFSKAERDFDTKQHIHHVCYPDDPQNAIESCCFEDVPKNTTPSSGVQRISTEWSAAFDLMPGTLIAQVMDAIANTGVAPGMHRSLAPSRQLFMRDFVQAQIVAYEAADVGVSQGWFFWTIKTEGGAFAEWDFTRGLIEAWIPNIVDRHIPSSAVYGSCDDIYKRTENRTDVRSDGYALFEQAKEAAGSTDIENSTLPEPNNASPFNWKLNLSALALIVLAVYGYKKRKKQEYFKVPDGRPMHVAGL